MNYQEEKRIIEEYFKPLWTHTPAMFENKQYDGDSEWIRLSVQNGDAFQATMATIQLSVTLVWCSCRYLRKPIRVRVEPSNWQISLMHCFVTWFYPKAFISRCRRSERSQIRSGIRSMYPPNSTEDPDHVFPARYFESHRDPSGRGNQLQRNAGEPGLQIGALHR